MISSALSTPAAAANAPAPHAKAPQSAFANGSGNTSFHDMLKAADGSHSQSTPKPTADNSALTPPTTTSVSTVEDTTPTALQQDDPAAPVAAFSDPALDASKLAAQPVAATPIAGDKTTVTPPEAAAVKTSIALDATSVKSKDAKRKHTGKTLDEANPQTVNTATTSSQTPGAIPFQLPTAFATPSKSKADQTSQANVIDPRRSARSAAGNDTTAILAPATEQKPAEAVDPVSAATILTVTPTDTGKGHTSTKESDTPDLSPALAPANAKTLSMHAAAVDVGATFRSSFLNDSAGTTKSDFNTQVKNAMDTSAEPATLPVNEGPVKHLEVALKDTGMGDISVRAEMRDGMLHASVFGGHADTFLTATALHQFLESSQVAVHKVHVETPGSNGIAKTVSTSSFASGSLSGSSDGQSGKNQEERARFIGSLGTKNWNSSDRNDWSSMPMTSAQVLPSTQYSDGRSLSIHI